MKPTLGSDQVTWMRLQREQDSDATQDAIDTAAYICGFVFLLLCFGYMGYCYGKHVERHSEPTVTVLEREVSDLPELMTSIPFEISHPDAIPEEEPHSLFLQAAEITSGEYQYE